MGGERLILRYRWIDSEHAAAMHRLMMLGFAGYRKYPLPSSALAETEHDVRRALALGAGVLVEARSFAASVSAESWVPVGGVRVRCPEATQRLVFAQGSDERRGIAGTTLSFERMFVLPDYLRRGIGAALVQHLVEIGKSLGCERLQITVRSQQPDNRSYYRRLGFHVTHYSERYRVPDMVTYMERSLVTAPTVESMS